MAKLTILSGAPHSGRTGYLYDRLAAHMERGEHAILLVPGQATYRAERALAERCGGLLGIEVYSLERLSERLIERCGQPLPFLNDRGRAMVLRRAALQCKNKLGLFARASQRQGFAAAMDARIGQFKQSCISPDDLLRAADRLPDGDLLKQKLKDFALLYRESESFLASRYLTANDLLTVAESLAADSWVRDCYVYADEFDAPGEQALRFLERILLTAKSVTLTLRQSDDPALAELYQPDRKLYERLYAFCAERGVPFSERTFHAEAGGDPALDHLCRNLFSTDPHPYPAPTEAVSFLAAKDRATEAALVADRVLSLVRGGLRYSDITLVTSEPEAYAPLIRRAFALRGIPLFYDATRPIGGLAAISFVRSAARAACLGFPMEDLLRLLKSGYADASAEDVEIFENYVIRYNIYGSECMKPFTLGEIPPEAEAVRAHMMETLLPLREQTAAPNTRERVRALWRYLAANDLRGKLMRESQTLLEAGQSAEAQVLSEVWRAVTALLEQLDTVLGDAETTRREFPALIDEGFSGVFVGVLPVQGDCVTLGDLMRTRLAPTDTLFVLGCTDGAFLPVKTDDELINNPELDTLRALGLPVWEGTQGESAANRLALHTLLSKIRSRIVFSFAFSDGKTELSRAALLGTIESLFPGVKETAGMNTQTPYPLCKPVAFSMLAELLSRRRQEGGAVNRLPELLAYFSADPDYAEATRALEAGDNASPAPMGREAARALYGKSPGMSASRLEQYARCPFWQYANYGLGAKERKAADETAADAGTFLHDALDAFVREVKERGLDWRAMTEADADAVLDAILPPLLVSHNDGIFSRDPIQRESLFLRLRTVRDAAYSILRQLSAGKYTVLATEMAFGMDGSPYAPIHLTLSDGTPIRIHGKIDRIDRTRDGKQFRIIDYKMGKERTFDPTKLFSGESLQLPLYVTAAEQLGGELSGMYYMPLSLDVPEEGETAQHKLYGLTAAEEESLSAIEPFEKSATLVHNLKRDKSGAAVGAAAERKRLEAIVAFARKIAAKQAEGILSGNAAVYPTESACKWCPYGSVCRFDKQNGSKTRYTRKISQDDLLSGKEDLP